MVAFRLKTVEKLVLYDLVKNVWEITVEFQLRESSNKNLIKILFLLSDILEK